MRMSGSGCVILLIVEIWNGTSCPLSGTNRHSFSRSTLSRLGIVSRGYSSLLRYTARSFASTSFSSPSPLSKPWPAFMRRRPSASFFSINSAWRAAREIAFCSLAIFSSFARFERRTPPASTSSTSSSSSSSLPPILYETSPNSLEILVRTSGTPSAWTHTTSARSTLKTDSFCTGSGEPFLSSSDSGILCNPTDKLKTIPGTNF
mmetsp:Transcript_37887/g.75516  ORF Transcript_37887/g.75516 Transcript_37887/m.75516 type:complete len:205 (-) Transcript_37887:1127-1741(-)